MSFGKKTKKNQRRSFAPHRFLFLRRLYLPINTIGLLDVLSTKKYYRREHENVGVAYLAHDSCNVYWWLLGPPGPFTDIVGKSDEVAKP